MYVSNFSPEINLPSFHTKKYAAKNYATDLIATNNITTYRNLKHRLVLETSYEIIHHTLQTAN